MRHPETSTRRQFLRASLGAAAILPWVGCAPHGPVPPFTPKRVFIITIDTLRRDHLSWYGYPRDTTPFLSGLARESAVFEEAICACSNTTPSHTSMFTGLHVAQHGMQHNAHAAMTTGLYFLSDYFQAAGYDSTAFASVVWMQLFKQGFATFDTYNEKYIQDESEKRYYRNAEGTVDAALGWLDKQNTSDRFFNFLHFYDPHDPYYPPEAILEETQRDGEGILAHWTQVQHKHLETYPFLGDRARFVADHHAYDAEVRFVDQQIERYYRAAEARGLLADSLWIVTADHGEGLGGHYYHGHGMHIYQEQISCPLLFHTPGGELPAQRLPHRVSHVDLFPTLADMIGQPIPASPFTLTGQSLAGLLRRELKGFQPAQLFCQRRGKLDQGFSKDWEPDPVCALLEEDFAYIWHGDGEDELYDLKNDPYQITNLLTGDLEKGMSWRETAIAVHKRLTEEGARHGAAIEGDTPYREALEALGYLGSGGE